MALPYGSISFEQLVRLQGKGVPIPVTATAPKPKPDHATPFLRFNTGLGKHEWCIQFPTGAAVVVATEP